MNRANVVDAVHVVGVIVGEQHGVDAIDAARDELQPQLGRRVDQQARSAIGLDHRADAGAAVARIGRAADGAVAADLRHAEARSGSEEGELHTTSTLSRLVVPGTSNGTPAVTMHAIARLREARAARISLARALATSRRTCRSGGTSAGTTPQTSASWLIRALHIGEREDRNVGPVRRDDTRA